MVSSSFSCQVLHHFRCLPTVADGWLVYASSALDLDQFLVRDHWWRALANWQMIATAEYAGRVCCSWKLISGKINNATGRRPDRGPMANNPVLKGSSGS